MNKKHMVRVGLSIFGVVFVSILVGKINLSIRFGRAVKSLFSQSDPIPDQWFRASQLEALPVPVQRYFRHILEEGQPYISYARIKHDGQFKTGLNKDWSAIKGEQYATTSKPGFIWKGTTNFFVARDMYISDTGRLIVSVLSVLNIVDAHGPKYNEGELLRWLGESILYPTNLLPGKYLQWFPIDAHRAKLTFDYKGLSLFFNITFNDQGEITEMETKRYMSENEQETWVIKAAGYKRLNRVLVPTSFDVLWRLPEGDFSYARFNIIEIEYDVPKLF